MTNFYKSYWHNVNKKEFSVCNDLIGSFKISILCGDLWLAHFYNSSCIHDFDWLNSISILNGGLWFARFEPITSWLILVCWESWNRSGRKTQSVLMRKIPETNIGPYINFQQIKISKILLITNVVLFYYTCISYRPNKEPFHQHRN